jgi:hypothetical protein
MIVKSQEACDKAPKEAQNPRAFPVAHNKNSRLGNSYTITPKRLHGFGTRVCRGFIKLPGFYLRQRMANFDRKSEARLRSMIAPRETLN